MIIIVYIPFAYLASNSSITCDSIVQMIYYICVFLLQPVIDNYRNKCEFTIGMSSNGEGK